MNTCRSADSKGVMGAECLQESNWGGPVDFEGVRRTAWRAIEGGQAEGNVPKSQSHYTMWLRIVKGILSRLFAAG